MYLSVKENNCQSFQKGVTNEITREKVMGKEYIWFKGMNSRDIEEMDNNITNSVQSLKIKNANNTRVTKK